MLAKLHVAVFLCILSFVGCNDMKGTIINYVNLSDDEIWADIFGITPNSSPGVLLPGSGTDQLSEVSVHFFDPVIFNERIKFKWTIKTTSVQKEVELNRDDFGIPAKVQGGEVKIIYTASGEWEMKYYRSPVRWKK